MDRAPDHDLLDALGRAFALAAVDALMAAECASEDEDEDAEALDTPRDESATPHSA